MTDYEIRIAIAEAHNPTVHQFKCSDELDGSCDVCDYNVNHSNHAIPDYLNDLNAIHKAVKTIIFPSDSLRGKYYSNLHKVCGRDKLWELKGNSGLMIALVEATAAQRAEAFLRTIGKWIDQTKEANE